MIAKVRNPLATCTFIAAAMLHAPIHAQVDHAKADCAPVDAEDLMSSNQWAAIGVSSEETPKEIDRQPLLLLTASSLNALRTEPARAVPVNPVAQTRLEIQTSLSLDAAASEELLFEYTWSRYFEFAYTLEHAPQVTAATGETGHYELDRIATNLDWLRLPPFNVRVGIGAVVEEGFYRGIDPRELVSVLTPADGVALFFSLRSSF